MQRHGPFLSTVKAATGKRASMSVKRAVEWAFFNEKASLDPARGTSAPQASSYGMEYVLMQQARLGCRVDSSGYVPEGHQTAPEADMVAAMVGGLPDCLGGRRVALSVAECGRMRAAPDWWPDAEPCLVPVEWRAANQYGRMAVSEVLEPEQRIKGRVVKRAVYYTRCRWVPSMSEVQYQRDRYGEWRDALEYLADAMQSARVLSFDITDELPHPAPWRART